MERSRTTMRSAVLVTASYAGDLERFRLLCETMDRQVSGHTRHIVLVSHRDLPLFKPFASADREILDERQILPDWLHDMPDPTTLNSRRIWISRRGWPLRGWHVQQLRKIAIARHVEEDALVFADSDVAFVRPFDAGSVFDEAGAVRLFRRSFELAGGLRSEQTIWSRNAGRILGLGEVSSPHDYVATLIAWRRQSVLDMMERIEETTGKGWVETLARQRNFSECMIYGRFCDEIDDPANHFLDERELCHTYWHGPRLDECGIRQFIDRMSPDQVAIALQSFTGADISDVRRAVA